MVLNFETLKFKKSNDNSNLIRATFMKNYYFELEEDWFSKEINITDPHTLEFTSDKYERRFGTIMNNGFSHLKNKITGRDAVYIHKNSGIPLYGTNYFGIVDRHSNLIEIKPVTGCVLNCIYCSIGEGYEAKKGVDFFVEADYMVEELVKLIDYKKDDDIEIHIGCHGEPLLYDDLENLLKKLSKVKEIKRISMDTNGVMLTKKKLEELKSAGLTQINISLNAIDPSIGAHVAGLVDKKDENFEEKSKRSKLTRHQVEMIHHASSIMDVIIAPVFLDGINNGEMLKAIELAKETKSRIGIQNFLNYKTGRNPVKEIKMDKFYKWLGELEKEYEYPLIFKAEDFKIHPTPKLNNPIKKNEKIEARVIALGRAKNEIIAATFGNGDDDRCIVVRYEFLDPNRKEQMGRDVAAGRDVIIRCIINRTKHNIFYAKGVKWFVLI